MNTDDNIGYMRFLDGPFKTERHSINYDFGECYWEQEGNGQNLRAGYESKHFDLVLWCENLFDEEYTLDPGMIAAIDGRPLTLGITLTGRF